MSAPRSSARLPRVPVSVAALAVAAVSACSSPPSSTPTQEGTSIKGASGIEVVASEFDVPWGLVPLDDGDALVGERDSAAVWRVPSSGERERVTTVPGVEPGGEGGLLGVAVPPRGDGTQFYAYLTSAEDNRVVEVDLSGVSPEGTPQVREVLVGIPKAGNHNGGRIAFGPDDYLYVTTGDASQGASAQDPDSLAGKILRVTVDGAPAPGNPDATSPVWSMGHRNVQGLDWDDTGTMWASEFGQNDLDELNRIEPGNNYGWPECEGPCGRPEFVDPELTWPTSDASPSGLAVGPDGALYMAALRGQSLWRIPLDGETAGSPERLLEGEYGRLRSVVNGPDGSLLVLTNNTSRGTPAADDDKLLSVPLP
ncbi:MAG: PQQ-dependent sugar dehydrogenase [Ornithinimicrobium sp.]